MPGRAFTIADEWPDPRETPTLTPVEAGALIGVSRATVYRLVEDGTLNAYRRPLRLPTRDLWYWAHPEPMIGRDRAATLPEWVRAEIPPWWIEPPTPEQAYRQTRANLEAIAATLDRHRAGAVAG